MIPLRRFAAYRNDADKMKRRTTGAKAAPRRTAAYHFARVADNLCGEAIFCSLRRWGKHD